MRKFILIIGCFMTTLSLAQTSFYPSSSFLPQNNFIDNDYIYNLNFYNIKGEVASVKTTKWAAQQEQGEIIKGRPRYDGWNHVQLDHFDKSGILIKSEGYGVDNDSLRSYSYLINNDGKLIKEEVVYYDKYKVVPITYHYDKKNKLIEKISYNQDKDIKIRHIYIYDYNGIISETIHCSFGQPCSHLIYEINEVQNTIFVKDLETNSSDLVKYDARGNWNEHSKYINGIISSQDKQAFDVKGNLTEQAFYDSDGIRKRLSVKWNYTYDQNDNITKEIKIRFNENGVRSYDEKRFIYKYDLKGNWVERIEYENNLPKEIHLRELNYYN